PCRAAGGQHTRGERRVKPGRPTSACPLPHRAPRSPPASIAPMAPQAWIVKELINGYDWYLQHRTPFEMVGLFLAVLGTLFAVLSIRDGQRMIKDLRTVFDHLTTKEIGEFPVYMTAVDRSTSDARESTFIATDCPGHGSWRDRGRYGAYVKAIENRKADRVRRGHPLSVQVLCLDAEGREQALQDRYPESRWKDYVKKGG